MIEEAKESFRPTKIPKIKPSKDKETQTPSNNTSDKMEEQPTGPTDDFPKTQKTNKTSNNTDKNYKGKTITPITLNQEKTYTVLKKNVDKFNIKIKHAKEVNGKIKIFPEKADDRRRITKLLDDKQQEYYCKHIDQEPVIKGVPRFITEEEIYNELKELGLDVTKVERMTKKYDNTHS